MKLFIYFYQAYPFRTIITCLAITIAAAMGGISITALIPLLSKAFSSNTSNEIELDFFDKTFAYLNINPNLETLAIIVIAGIILKSIILAAAKIYAGFTVAKVVKDLRIKLLSAVSLAEWKYFTNQPAGKLAASLMGESARGGRGYLTSIEIISSIVQITAYMGIAFFFAWEVAVLVLITSLFIFILFRKFISKNKDLGEEHTQLSRKITSQLIDSTRSIKSLKAMGRESHTNALIESYTKKIKKVAKKLKMNTELLSASQEIFLTAAIALGIYIAVYKLNTSTEYVIVLSILYIRTVKLAGKSQKQYQSFVADLSGFNGVIESIENAKNNFEKRTGSIKYTLNNNISLKNITFSHGDNLILENASAIILHNKINTIIGESGVGKTTLVDLICGLYNTRSGKIYIDDVCVEDIDIHHWRSQIGYVVQENTLLNNSIKENVTLGDSNFSNQDVIAALTAAHAITFTNQLTDGINTIVGENGAKLSGGQRQRILIARALVHSPKLLILDEATSALDNETEISLSNIFKELSQNLTIISISHRQAMVDVSDHIIEIKDKKLVEL